MGLVAFEQIQKVMLQQASQLGTSNLNPALGPITGTNGRTTLYDPLWGYFLFGQTLKMDYHDTYTYMDHGEFTISGQFTIDAEDAIQGNASTSDDMQFNRVVARYTLLEQAFETAGKAAAPASFIDWGTKNDPRCIPLPAPLLDAAGHVIYCEPMELTVEPGQWGKFIAYKATLREAKYPPGKVVLNNTFLDDGIITITCPKPILNRTPLVGCCAEVIQVSNYTVTEVEVQGTINGIHAPARAITDLARNMLAQLTADKVNIGVQRVVGSSLVTDVLFPLYSLDEGSNCEVHFAEQVVQVNIKAKAGHF